MLSGPGFVLCMIRESHIILKTAFHSRLAVNLAAASLLLGMLYCPVWLNLFNVSLGSL